MTTQNNNEHINKLLHHMHDLLDELCPIDDEDDEVAAMMHNDIIAIAEALHIEF